MATTGVVEIQMPQMGESVTEGTVLEWHKHEGEFVEEGETVVEVSTDKVDAEVPAPASGVITKILAEPDETSQVGQVLAQLDPTGEPSGERLGSDGAGEPEPGPGLTAEPGGEGDADLGEETPAESPAAGRATAADAAEAKREAVGQISMPEMGESVTEGTVLEWHKSAEGDSVEEGETVVEVSTDKVDAEVPAPASGTITKLLVAARRRRPGRPGARGDDRRRRRPRRDGARPQLRADAASRRRPHRDGDGGTREPPRRAAGRRGQRASTSAPSRARAPAAR